MYRQLERVLEIFSWSDSWEVINEGLQICCRIFSDRNIKYAEFDYLGTNGLARLLYHLIFFIQQQNCFNPNKIQLGQLFKDDEQYQKYAEAKGSGSRRKKTSVDLVFRPATTAPEQQQT